MDGKIVSEGKHRWMECTDKGVTVRERVPLHVEHMDEERAKFHLRLIHNKLRKKLAKAISQGAKK
jgi:hypothetical protein